MTVLLGCLCLFTGIHGKIQGIVYDKYTEEPIPYVDVILQNTQMGAATDEEGRFFILNIPPGTYTVECSYVGYQTTIIKNVVVMVDQTTRLTVEIVQTMIEMPPVTVTSKMPYVQKDYVGTTYIVRQAELPHLPVDYATNIVAFQAAVVHTDTSLHVRGGRATEVLYMIDNVSVMDPQTGDLAINVSKGIVDEVVFLPGGFDAEYGRAMSGVINMISKSPPDYININTHAKTEEIMPFYYDFGYQNYQSNIQVPFTSTIKGLFAVDVMHTDDWDPKLYILPHKKRDDYSLYGKMIYTPSGKIRLSMSGAKSRSQFDRYHSYWKFYLDHYRSDMRIGDLQVLSFNYLPNTKFLVNVTLSRLMTMRAFGAREKSTSSILHNFQFVDYSALQWPRAGLRNPFGASQAYIICQGDYPEYQEKSSHVIKINLGTNLQLHKFHEIKAGAEYTYQNLENFDYFISDPNNQIVDEYKHFPKEYVAYLQDNIDFKGLYSKIGCRFEYFDWNITGMEPLYYVSPRFGISFMVTEKFLFRTNIGQYVQPPLYDYIYAYYDLLPIPAHIQNIPPIGNPRLTPEKTTAFEIGLQGEVEKNVNLTINSFYKLVTNLIGTRLDSMAGQQYISFFNVEYANVSGIEAIIDFSHPVVDGKVSYTLSWAKGVSSYALEVWERRDIDPEFKPAAREYYLDFDQRKKLFAQGTIKAPMGIKCHVFAYLGDGFPYTPPGPEGKYEERNIMRLPFQRRIDCVLSKSLKIGKFALNVDFEVMNILFERYEISPHYTIIPLDEIKMEYFDHPPPYIDLPNGYYAPPADLNHDGIITPQEEYQSYRDLIEATDDWVNAYTSPRRARLGVTLSYQ